MIIRHKRRILPLLACLGLVASLAWGCGDSEDDDHSNNEHNEVEPADDACEHAQDGPFEDITATDDESSAPDASAEHTAYRIDLNEAGDGTHSGMVSFTPEEAGEFHIFTSTDTADLMVSHEDQTLTAEAESSVDAAEHCAEVTYQWTFDMDHANEAYLLDFSGSDDATILMVVVHGGEHEEHANEE